MSEKKSSCCGADARLHREVDREKTSIYHTEYKDDYTCKKCGKPCDAKEASSATPHVPCDFCGKDTDGKLVLRDTRIGKKDGSDVALCPDCLNHYAAGEYDKIKLKSPSEPEQTECQSEHSHKVGVEPRVAGTSRSLERQSQSTDTPSESSARNICKACGFDRNAPREPIVCDSNPLSIASYFEDQCEGCGHKKDGSNIISPSEPGQGVRGHGADARVASVKGLDLPPESSGREIDREKIGTFDKSSIKNDVLEQLYPKSMVTNCEHEWSGDDVAKHCIKCGVGEDIIEAIDLTLAAIANLPERRKALGCPAPEDECAMCEEVIMENCTKFVSKSAVLALVDAKIDKEFNDRIGLGDLNNFETVVLDALRRRVKSELRAEIEKEVG